MRAYETQLEFSGAKGHAVIVEFDKPWRLIFWSKAQYVACWDLGNGVWFTPEWLETNSPEDFHCYEPIMDKQLKYSRVRIVESGPARAKVHWHYACCNIRYQVFNGNTTADEYYTVYPNGVAVRKLVAWPGDESDFGGNSNFWQVLEWILVNASGTTPDSTLHSKQAFTLQNGQGEKIGLPWPLPTNPKRSGNRALCSVFPEIADWNEYIGRVHVKDRPDPYVIFVKDQRIFPYKRCVSCGKDHPYFGLFDGAGNVYKHWPATDMEDFILAAKAGEDARGIPTHSSFVDCNYTSNPADRPPRPTTWLFLTGATNKMTSSLVEIMKSWYYPADIETGYESGGNIPGMSQGGLIYEGYAYSEMAYRFRKFGEDKIGFRMRPREAVINPVFIINNWKSPSATMSLDGEKIDKNLYQGQIEGDDIVIWLDKTISESTQVLIEG